MAQEQVIRGYGDSFVKGVGEHDTGSSEALTAKARAVLEAVKTRL